jgi:septation ring formation regulator EzrA
VFIELPKFSPHSIKEKKMAVLWLRFLTEINEKTMEAPEELLENPEVSEALKIVEIAAYTPEEMRAYDKFWDAISTRKTEIYDYELKIQKAKAELQQVEAELQQAEAKAEQAEAKILNTARRMKARNYSFEEIAEMTGLSEKQIEAL